MTEPQDREQERMRALLRAAADPAPVMPPDVVARVDAALAGERDRLRRLAMLDEASAREAGASPVASLAERRRRTSRWRRGLVVAASVVVIGGGAYLAASQGMGGGDTGSAGSSSGGADTSSAQDHAMSGTDVAPLSGVPAIQTGNDYTSVEQLAAAAVQTTAGGADPLANTDRGGAADTTVPESGGGGATGVSGVDPVVVQDVLECAGRAGLDTATVRLVEIAAWQGAPAALVVTPGPDGQQVSVFALDCRTAGSGPLVQTPLS